jgi:hypothetical protein
MKGAQPKTKILRKWVLFFFKKKYLDSSFACWNQIWNKEIPFSSCLGRRRIFLFRMAV